MQRKCGLLHACSMCSNPFEWLNLCEPLIACIPHKTITFDQQETCRHKHHTKMIIMHHVHIVACVDVCKISKEVGSTFVFF